MSMWIGRLRLGSRVDGDCGRDRCVILGFCGDGSLAIKGKRLPLFVVEISNSTCVCCLSVIYGGTEKL